MRVILSFGVGRDCAAAAPKRHAPERSAGAGAASAASSSGTHRDQELAAEAAPTKNHPVDGVAPLPWATRRSGPRPSARSCPGSAGKIGKAHVCTPITNEHHVCRLLLEKKNKIN